MPPDGVDHAPVAVDDRQALKVALGHEPLGALAPKALLEHVRPRVHGAAQGIVEPPAGDDPATHVAVGRDAAQRVVVVGDQHDAAAAFVHAPQRVADGVAGLHDDLPHAIVH